MHSSYPTMNGRLLSLPIDEVGEAVPEIFFRKFNAACMRRLAQSGLVSDGQKNFGYGRVSHAVKKKTNQ